LVGAGPGAPCAATQTAVASFTRYGFEAAAVTGLAVATSAPREPREIGIERTAILRFDHPYAAIAIAGRPTSPRPADQPAPAGAPLTGLPLFTAWVHEPEEAEAGPPDPGGSRCRGTPEP
jgi:hypothetical protein